jgi:VWFA-related protein
LLTAATAFPVEPGEVRIRSGPYRPAPVGTIAVETRLVETGVAVRDRRGEPVGGFHESDFEVLDNGKPQRIVVFAEHRAEGQPAQASTPRSLALYFDDTHAINYDLIAARKAAEALVSGGMQAGDRVGVFTDSGEVTQDFTADRELLLGALTRLRVRPRPMSQAWGACPAISPYMAWTASRGIDQEMVALLRAQLIACNCPEGDPDCIRAQQMAVSSTSGAAWDHFREQVRVSLKVQELVVRHLAAAPGKRFLLVLSPGFVTGDLDERRQAVAEAAIRGNIVISALNPRGLDTVRRSLVQKDVTNAWMSEATSGTGGSLIQDNNDVSGALKGLVAAPAVSYVLAFTPQGEADSKMHKLQVRLKRGEEYRVEARQAYFSEPSPAPQETPQQAIDRVVAAQQDSAPIPASVKVAAGSSAIRVEVGVDAKGLRFVERNGRSLQQLTFVTLLQDGTGKVLEGKESVMDLELSAATLADFRAKGIRTAVTLRRPQGTWKVKEVLREAADRRVASWTVEER